MYFVIPDWMFWTFAITVWVAFLYVFIIKPVVIPRIDDYFYQRRLLRRARRYLEEDALNTAALFAVAADETVTNTPTNSKKKGKHRA